MIIKGNGLKDIKPFSALKSGDCFYRYKKDDHDLYMAITNTIPECTYTVNVVNLITGELFYLGSGCEVLPVEATVTVQCYSE